MTTNSPAYKADPLVWGHGTVTLEIFVEPTCPFSARTFDKLDDLLARAGEDRLTVKLRLHSQPWHQFSPAVTRAIIAASTTRGGKDAAKSVMAAVYAHRQEFDLAEHRTGPNLDQSIRGILQLIERYSGIQVSKPFELPGLDREMKWHARYARQNGIHSSPTFMVNGIVMTDMSSGDTVDAWLGKLGLA
jgi:protein-disulfide isomerase